MIVVISCAGSKHSKAGKLKTKDGTPVKFVAHPGEAPDNPAYVYAHPDDPSGYGMPWRNKLLDYNKKYQDTGDNPDGLLPAWQLYENPAYGRLFKELGPEKVYILSAGWGLIKSTFLTSYYDITFSTNPKVEKWKRRNFKKDKFEDNPLSKDISDTIVFFGGKDYIPLFCKLTRSLDCRKIVLYTGKKPLVLPNYRLKRSDRKGQKWYYQCAKDFLDGYLDIEECCQDNVEGRGHTPG